MANLKTIIDWTIANEPCLEAADYGSQWQAIVDQAYVMAREVGLSTDHELLLEEYFEGDGTYPEYLRV